MALDALLVLEDGTSFPCRTFAGSGEVAAEVCFNTSMTGYQEAITDPSYKGQMLAMTYPLIGNYGVNSEDPESHEVRVSAFLVKEYQEFPSNFRSSQNLGDYLEEAGVMGVEGLDTRALTRHLRIRGAMRGVLSTQDLDPASLAAKAQASPGLVGVDLVKEVTCQQPYRWLDGRPGPDLDLSGDFDPEELWAGGEGSHRVVCLDCGIKYNILRRLAQRGNKLIVVPASTPAETILGLQPDGVFLSNGPGDPAAVTYVVDTVKNLLGRAPIFGICLGHQMIGQALGGKTFKLKFGHRGANQPVMDLKTSKVEITSQNHGFCVDADTIDDPQVVMTHLNINDRTLEGLAHRQVPLFCVQYHPEAAPGPHDADYLFDRFQEMMRTKAPLA
ncbi:MAG: glutamine-hydrolyzing carbamoyl-phosphate synthase small subunit [Proteobacteria bacterium]|nr:glutamine-hydrolyzing carbamoyl-phosphate synthase small subunit [Pseudomonadota bacterium]MBU1450253.1 glutamine-hydrolyzing carbamoyl-phosphate synthase small subunit [Pseudomonadota bacterium]MBU2469746.1 glutamine-hydrolyzing carbamoyl-phosphate synthase small subunit [Pseudomonadota bacterium]